MTGTVSSVSSQGPLQYINWARWWGEAHYILELRVDTLTTMENKLIAGYAASTDSFGYNLSYYHKDLLAMFLIGLGLRMLTYLLIKKRTK